MKKMFFRNFLTSFGLGILVMLSALFGSILIREARSFIDPGSGPGASGVLGTDVGVIGNPSNGISGADTLFKGQKVISDKEGNPSDGIPGASTLFKGQKAIKDAIGGGGGGGLRTKRVFVTSTTYNGNLGGLAGADAKCQARADAATLGGTWKAILSDSTTNAKSRIGSNWDRLIDMAGNPIADKTFLWDYLDSYWNGSQVVSRYIYNPVDFNEFGAYIGGSYWSGTTTDGFRASDSPPTAQASRLKRCVDWTSSYHDPMFFFNSSFGQVGGGSKDRQWINSIDMICDLTSRLLCVEQ